MNEHQRITLARIPASMQTTYEKACNGSKAAAIKAFCQQCTGYDRKAVAECTSRGCPLYPHRPYQPKASEEAP